MKTCIKCLQEKTLNHFSGDRVRKDGLSPYCKLCNSELNAKYYSMKNGSTHPLKKMRTKSAEQRFWLSHEMNESGCWIWKGRPQGSNGYGRIKVNGTYTAAHRYSYFLHCGDIQDGMLVMHICDTPLCVNPAHLVIGTHQDNMDDKVSKNRQASGPQLASAQQAGKQRKRKSDAAI